MATVLQAMLSKDHSFGTGIVLALLVWTLGRLVDSITGGSVLEYEIVTGPAALVDGQPVTQLGLTMTNLSRDTIFKNIRVTIYGADDKTQFVVGSQGCVYVPPAPVGDPSRAPCYIDASGFSFGVETFVPATTVHASVKYSGPTGDGGRPIVRIRPDPDAKIRVVEASLATWLAKRELWCLLGLLLVAVALLVASVRAGVRP